jgi:hypothetical protein
VIKQLRVPAWAWSELAEPRVVPLATNALYYTLLVVSVGGGWGGGGGGWGWVGGARQEHGARGSSGDVSSVIPT